LAGAAGSGAGLAVDVTEAAGDLLAELSDSFIMATNNLIQYPLAIDRGNSRIAHLHDLAVIPVL